LRSGRGTGLNGTYFSAAIGIMGFWGFWDDMTGSSSRRARPYGSNEHCDGWNGGGD
jgi:hypothetical protein